ncbi:hypothetical protein [Cohnella sp. AR92]|uniref:hypothetical protein n=1 Tax=Cohnella sp. AR92 TaxID=648716 RepID=UPI000F8EAD29|nr:hypothetical protein [Cohnella sp. AR92]RUS47606.1 hypothetical protein ELR57_07390 [Cohnella sp. AR92]
MNAIKLQRSNYFVLGLLVLVILTVDAFAARTPSLNGDPLVLYAVLFDYMLVVPFLCWLLLLRKQGKSIRKAAPLAIVGAAAAWIAVPASMRSEIWKAAWPLEAFFILLELAVIGFELRLAYRFAKRFREVSKREPNKGEALRTAMYESFGNGRTASLLLHDISMLYYLFFSWGRGKRQWGPSASSYTYHRKSGLTLYAIGITHLIVFEGVAMHFLLLQWSAWAAWFLSVADLWLLGLLWADYRASVLQPIVLSDGVLRIRYGLRLQADVPVDLILHAESSAEYRPSGAELRRAISPPLAVPNVSIELDKPLQANGLLFLPRSASAIYLAVDEPGEFVRAVNAARIEGASKSPIID